MVRMFRRWPFFQRLLSWTKPHAPVPRGSRAYERYDWNSLLGDTPVIESVHPSPLSASRGFFGSRPFSRANAMLEAQGGRPVDWRLPVTPVPRHPAVISAE